MGDGSAPWTDPRIISGMKAQLAARRMSIAGGDKPLGWKVGFGAPAIMEKFKTTAPLVGHLMQSGRLASGTKLSLATWVKPVLEPEIAITMGRDLAAGRSRADAADAIAHIQPAFELVDADLPFEDPEAILKRNIFQRHVVLGDELRSGGSTAGLVGTIFRNATEVARTEDPEALTGKLPDLVRHVADLLGAFGEKLRSNNIIIAGSVVPPILIEPTDATVSFDLEPVGRISIRFSGRS